MFNRCYAYVRMCTFANIFYIVMCVCVLRMYFTVGFHLYQHTIISLDSNSKGTLVAAIQVMKA